MFELQDDENEQLDLQDRQQGDDNSDGRVEVSSAILIAGGVAGGRLTVQEILKYGDAGRKALRNQLRQCTNVVNVPGGIEQPEDSKCASEELYGDALAFPWPVAPSMTTMPPPAKGLPVVAFIDPGTSRAVMTEPSRMLSYHGGRIFHSSVTKEAGAAARNLYWAGLALNLERIQPLEDSLTRCAPLRILVAQDTGRKALASTAPREIIWTDQR